MSKKMMRSVLAVLLALMMLFVFAACDNTPGETTLPDTTEPDVTEPDETTPEVTEPEETDPEVTTPEETLPDETLPDETLPEETQPEETDPEATTPEDTTLDPNAPHTHVYNKTGGVPTCVQNGTVLYTCVCGDMYEEEGEPAYGHTWVLTNEIIPATCEEVGLGEYKCDFCGWDSTHEIPVKPHDLSVSTLVVSAEDDTAHGKGYEFLACADCLYMEKVTANHGSGHSFVKNEDGTITCRCGAVAEDIAKDAVLKNDFSDAEDNKLKFNEKKKEGVEKWWISGASNQHSMVVANIVPELTDILKGSYEGDSIAAITYSFVLEYEGTVPEVYGGGGVFFTWRSNPIKYPTLNYNEEITLNLTKAGEKLLLACPAGGGSIELEEGKKYKVSVNLDPINDTIGMSVYEESMSEPVILAEPYEAVEDLSELWAIFMSRSTFYYGGDDFSLYADDMEVSYVARNIVAEGTIDSCEHTFVSQDYVDDDHYLFEKWYRETCEDCGRYYFNQDCEALGGHRFSETPDSYKEGSCTTPSIETYVCEICGFEDVHEIVVEHGLLTLAGIVSAANDPAGKGYELWACDCGYAQKVYGNHESGHLFVKQPSGNGLCRCGAVNDTENGLDESEVPEICEHEFTSESFEDFWHPAYGHWYLDTCSLCGIFVERMGCEYTGHVWSAEPVDGDIGNCQTSSYTVYECLSCHELDVRTADKGPHSYTLFVSITPASGDATGYETWMCDLCHGTTTIEGNHASGHNFDGFTKECLCGATSEKLTAVRDEQQSADRIISKENSQPSFAVDSEAFSGTWEGETVEYVRLSYKMCYKGDPRLSQGGKKTKYWMFSEWRFDVPSGGYESVQLWLNLAGEKAKFGYDIEPEIKPNVVYTVWYELELKTNIIRAYIGAEGEETLLLYTYKLKQKPTDSWRLHFSPNHVGYTPNTDDFSLTISQIRVEAVEYVVDESNMLTPTPVE